MADDTIIEGESSTSRPRELKNRDSDNSIGRPRRRSRDPEAPVGSSDSARGGEGDAKSETRRIVPDHILKRFVKVGERYYFRDGAHAFSDRGSRLTTKSENTEVVKSLIEIAEVRGWREIAVTGTERFRREAWMAATAVGLEVKGYTPTEIDRAYVARQRARDATSFSFSESGEDRSTVSKNGAAPPERTAGLIRGRLVDHGVAPYRHDPREGISYFVKVETPDGGREVWGVDLERALKHSLTRPERGDLVALRAVRREHVTVQTPKRSPDGKIVGQTPLDVHRNHWIVERAEFFEARAAAARTLRDPRVDAKQGARQHPELVGTYLQMHAAEIAARQLRDPQDREKFVSRVRAALADAVARGEALPPVRLKERAAAPKSPEREEAPTR